jgi:hypothetical protein
LLLRYFSLIDAVPDFFLFRRKMYQEHQFAMHGGDYAVTMRPA